MIQNRPQIEQVISCIFHLFTIHHIEHLFLVYHNLAHTISVVSRSQQIASFYNLNNNERYILTTAAWFHDCGHLKGPAMGHEARSVLMLEQFVGHSSTNDSTVERIANCILSTKIPSHPNNILERILCDADLFHLGTKEFFKSDLLVKREYELRNHVVTTNWDENSLALLQSHRYHTKYCRELLNNGKAENIATQIKRISQKSYDEK